MKKREGSREITRSSDIEDNRIGINIKREGYEMIYCEESKQGR